MGVTTVTTRKQLLLPRTLRSLQGAGFTIDRLFADNEPHTTAHLLEGEHGIPVTARCPALRSYGNWILALAELYIRDPAADRYAIFQDDLAASRNLKLYLDQCNYPDYGYWNLYTFPSNQSLAPQPHTNGNGKGDDFTGWYPSNQFGRGALGLVFSRQTVQTLLSHQHMVLKPTDVHRGWKSIDGAVVTALKAAGYTEYVHTPSLLQHTGTVSSIGNNPHPLATSWRGEDFDCLTLLPPAAHEPSRAV